MNAITDVHSIDGIEIGHYGRPCGRTESEDFFDFACPPSLDRTQRGLVIALADGMSSPGGGGRRAAETCVASVLSDYYATPAAWEVPRALDRIVGSVNAWLLAHNQRVGERQSMISTLSVLVLRGGRHYVAHVGDTRICRLRDRQFESLTTDHVWPRGDMRHVLRRAVGLDEHLVMEFSSDPVQPGDLYLMMSDGVWEVLGETGVREAMRAHADVSAMARALVEDSLARQRTYYGRNDATAAVIRVRQVVASCDGG